MKRFEGTAELAGNLSQAVHLALNDVSSEVAFIPSGSEIFFYPFIMEVLAPTLMTCPTPGSNVVISGEPSFPAVQAELFLQKVLKIRPEF